MKRELREFIEQEETGAARSKAAKRADRKRRHERFLKFLVEKAEKLEANGNPAGAEQVRAFWRKFPEFAKAFPKSHGLSHGSSQVGPE